MKYSHYNNIVPLTDKYSLLYNAFTDSYLLLDSSLSADLLRDSEALSRTEPQVFEDMKRGGCFVEESADEHDELMTVIGRMNNDDSHYQIIVNPTLNCNCRCWYCYEEHQKDSKMTPETVESVKRLIDKVIESKPELKHFHLSFFGGEPLLYYFQSVEPLIEHLNARCEEKGIERSVSFTSNAVAVTPKMVDSFVRNKVNSMQITLDGHREEHNKVRFIGVMMCFL